MLRERLCQKHLPGTGGRAEPRCLVQRRSAEAIAHSNGRSCLDADPGEERKVILRLLFAERHQLHCRSDRMRRRGEDRHHLVPAHLHDTPVPSFDGVLGERGERLRETSRLGIATLTGEARVAADVGDQEGPLGDLALYLGNRRTVTDLGHRRMIVSCVDEYKTGRGRCRFPRGALLRW
jgi:hypothetical protein